MLVDLRFRKENSRPVACPPIRIGIMGGGIDMKRLASLFLAGAVIAVAQSERPNILFAISDDQSAMHAGAYGDVATKTPAFDRVAREGILFNYAFTASPSCAPSRSAILTGRNIWEVEEGGILLGILKSKFTVFTLVLEDAGYEIGATGKTWSPGRMEGWDRDVFGKRIATHRLPESQQRPGLNPLDYAANFDEFFAGRDQSKPFFFWLGTSEPHQRYDIGAWKRAGKRLEDARLPGALPDHPDVRGEILDYGVEIEHFDSHLARAIATLETAGELDNTLVIVTSDHGNPLPRSKCNLYDSGTRVPLAMRLPGSIPPGRTVDDLVSLADIAPTILNAASVDVPAVMSGRSLWRIAQSGKSGLVDESRDFVVTAFERHTIARRGGVGYPMRAIRTHQYSYIRNYEPDRWPAGDPDYNAPPQGFFGDVDRGVTKSFLMANALDPEIRPYYLMAYGRRPAEELYDIETDPHQLRNIAADPALTEVKQQLIWRLNAYLQATGDPRQRGATPWDEYPFTGSWRLLENPNWKLEGMPARLPN